MSYAQTIAMAQDLLADGRAEDVVRMVTPLLNTGDHESAADQAMLRAVLARVHGVHTGDVERALHLLAPFESASARTRLAPPTRAAVTLWLGWAHARRDETFDEEARALNLLDSAQQLFQDAHDVRGRCWTHLGQAQAYFTIDEYQLMRDALAEADALFHKIRDVQAERWLHDLSIAALRFNGHYAEAQSHIDALDTLGRRFNHRQVQGRAAAYQAALDLDRGRPPDRIIDTAARAETLLRRAAAGIGYPLLAAYHAHISALVCRGDWEKAHALIQRALNDVSDHPVARAHLQTLQTRLALRRNQLEPATAIMESLFEHAHRLPHGLQRSHVALLRGELLARTERFDEAQQWMERAYRNARETGHRGNQLRALLTLADLALNRDDLASADAYLSQTDAYDAYFRVLPFAARRFLVLGRRARTAQDAFTARSYLTQAHAAYSLMGDVHRTAEVQLLLFALLPSSTEKRTLLQAATETLDRLGLKATPPEPELSQAPSPAQKESAASKALPIGTMLAHAAASSVQVVAEAWTQAVQDLLPSSWVGIFQKDSEGAWSVLHEHGTAPDPAPAPALSIPPQREDSLLWLPLHPRLRPTICMGVALADAALPDGTEDAHCRLQPWLPVAQLAFERALLRHAEDRRRAPSAAASSFAERFVHQSASMQHLAERTRRIQSSHNPVLITGERGVGKSTLAATIHRDSERSDGPWQTMNCASVPPDPMDARLFGRVTGEGLRTGLVQNADGGTLFLREVGALPLSIQEKLLQVLTTGEVFPNGAETPLTVDVRVLASATDDLSELVHNGAFRKDLYYRLRVISLHIPPLRERREDIPLLVRHFLHTLRPAGTPVPTVTPRAMETLLHYDWPGNVRQLQNEIERILPLVSSEPAPTVRMNVLSDTLCEDSNPPSPDVQGIEAVLQPNCDLSDVLAQTEKSVIERVLAECNGQITASARMLGLTRQGLYKKMKRLDIDAAPFQSADPALAGSA